MSDTASSARYAAARDLFDQFVIGGIARIEAAVTNREWESGLLDFKQNCDHGIAVDRITDESRDQFGRLLSAFANTNGGVCVWGVEAKVGKADFKPIPNIKTFIHGLEEQLSALTDPPVTGIVTESIEMSEGAGYAGGILSAAVDGIKVAEAVALALTSP